MIIERRRLYLKLMNDFPAESGTPLFEMDIDIEVPVSISEVGLREDLHHLAKDLMIDLVLRKM